MRLQTALYGGNFIPLILIIIIQILKTVIILKTNKALILFIILSAVALAIALSVKIYDDSRTPASHSGVFVKEVGIHGC